MEKVAYLAGGCFWCLEGQLIGVPGVKHIQNGYSGGDEKDVTYEQVKHQLTGHKETVKVIYDDDKVSYQQILEEYIKVIDPLDNEGQFIDKGNSYKCVIFYQNENEKEMAIKVKRELEALINHEAYIEVVPFKFFILAEEEHQEFYKRYEKEYHEELITSGRKKR